MQNGKHHPDTVSVGAVLDDDVGDGCQVNLLLDSRFGFGLRSDLDAVCAVEVRLEAGLFLRGLGRHCERRRTDRRQERDEGHGRQLGLWGGNVAPACGESILVNHVN